MKTASAGPSAFDSHHPPERDLVSDCVHCGFCLPTCPTYLVLGEEMDSPRGRIYLIGAGLDGRLALNETVTSHFDKCLGCLACVPACPSGVQYDKLIGATKAQVERNVPRKPLDRIWRELIFALFPHPERLRPLATTLAIARAIGLHQRLRASPLAARLPARLRALLELAPKIRIRDLFPRVPTMKRSIGASRARVMVLSGCVQSVFFARVNAATVRVLAADGCDVMTPANQGCCGALSLHSGREDEAAAAARKTIDFFERYSFDWIVTNAAGCGSSMKEYGHLLRDDSAYAARAADFSARIRDVTEVLAELGPRTPRKPLPLSVAYHDACHLSNAQAVRAAPRQILRAIPGLTLLEPAESEICCGSAGIYNLVEPDIAGTLGDRKARNLMETSPDVIVNGNPGCTLQIRAALRRAGSKTRVLHTIELIDWSIRGVRPGKPPA